MDAVSSLPCPLQQHAAEQPDAPALYLPGGTLDYDGYNRVVDGAAIALRQAGVVAGDIVALALPPGYAALVLLPALFRLGAIAFPLNPRFPEAYLLTQVRRFDCRHLVVQDDCCVDAGDELQVHRTGTLLRASGESPADSLPLESTRAATMILTSGSTGTPKAAVHSYGNHYTNALRSNANLPFARGDRWLLSLPLHHVAGIGVLFRTLLAGAAVIVPDPSAELATQMSQQAATHVSLVATQLYRLMQTAPGRDALAGCKAILLGGSGIPEALVRAAHAEGLPIYTSYGMTEMATQICTTAPGAGLDALLSAGRPLAEGILRIAPDGEIQVRGETLFLGYAEGGALRRPMTVDGWFPTGDLGRLDASGHLHVVGRKDNLFIAGGENVQPEEVEGIIGALPTVQRVLVVPVPDAEFGVLPVAFVRLVAGDSPDAGALRATLASDLPRFKMPRQFLAWPEDLCPGDEKPRRAEFSARAVALLDSSGGSG